jgi:hypothetical protein
MNCCRILFCIALTCASAAQAQLAVTVSPPKVTGQKAVVLLTMENHFGKDVESARAICFLLDEQGNMIGKSTKWVVGQNKTSLPTGATNTFNFVITNPQAFTNTNLTAKVSFSRVVLAGGQVADMNKVVATTEAPQERVKGR